MSGSPAHPEKPRITILLCTYNGAAHLDAQLQSYLAQDYSEWDLWVSDDGSTDETNSILERFRLRHGASQGRDIRLLKGPGCGVAANFMSLLCNSDLPLGPVALSDQDDIWMPHKLSRAMDGLRTSVAIALYGGQSLHTDTNLRVIGRSSPPRLPPSFRNALVQNVVSGHSAVLSAGALDLVRRAGPPEAIPYQDWWLYMLVSGAGGDVVIDGTPVLFYRQHSSNVMGAHQGARATLARMAKVMRRDYGCWITANLAALSRVDALLTVENRHILAALQANRRSIGPMRALTYARAGLHRQSRISSGFLYLAAMLGRV
jgi:glycosyltransferase involved in cell wall biosynthesis